MLPNQAKVLNQSTVDLGWAQANDYMVQLAPPAGGTTGQGFERHVIIQVDAVRAYDFFMTAPTADQLNQLVPVLEHMLGSIKFGTS